MLQQRIARARHLLRQTELPLHQIALDSGFATQSHFTQVFRRATGLTPKAYRQRA
ncbi:MAG: helix-turn-helix domain-containing protein [Anaerolineae bacterium]